MSDRTNRGRLFEEGNMKEKIAMIEEEMKKVTLVYFICDDP